jgi:hypothetical protein
MPLTSELNGWVEFRGKRVSSRCSVEVAPG